MEMSVEFINIENAGDLARERLVLRARGETEIGHYAVFRCRVAPEGRAYAGAIPNAYWFANRIVKSEDWIVLYTKNGTNSEKKVDDGPSSYFYYWRIVEPIWTPGYMPVIVETPTWHFGRAITEPFNRIAEGQ
jgi:hypothetical protein